MKITIEMSQEELDLSELSPSEFEDAIFDTVANLLRQEEPEENLIIDIEVQ